jgi:phosphopantothenoylcysteine decarboxylase / phosphopantothenate---cysteine ligase
MNLRDKTIILGVSGGIAAYKAVELLRLMTKAGAEVHVVMTKAATEFVTPLTFQALSGNPVHTELFSLIQEQEIGHISLADRADAVVIAPATANIIGKLAHGIADDLLGTTVMATKAPVLIAPAMNVNMYENRIYRENEAVLRKHGYFFVDPEPGLLACGWQGKGRLAGVETIYQALCSLFAPKDLEGQTVMVTAGPTREELDPVRYITNHSSGKMGYAIAEKALQRGATVLLISGPVALEPPPGVELIPVTTAEEMYQAVISRIKSCTMLIKAAAVADYTPAARNRQKIKKKGDQLSLELQKTKDILAAVGALKKRPLIIGFAAETTDLVSHARIKLESKNLDMIVANDVSQAGVGFNADNNRASLIYRDGSTEELELMSKQEMAGKILDRAIALIRS